MTRLSLTRKPAGPPAETTNTQTAASLRAEAAGRRENAGVIARRVMTAEYELQNAETTYGFHLERFAVDESAGEPDRAPIEAAAAKVHGLRRIAAENETEITRLEAEAKRVDVEQLGPVERTRIAEISADAEKLLGTYQKAIRAAKAAEAELFEALSVLRTGDFRAVRHEALRAHAELMRSAEDAAIDVAYQLDPAHLNGGYPVDLDALGPFLVWNRRNDRNAERRRALAS